MQRVSSGTLAARTIDGVYYLESRTHTAATTISSTFNLLQFARLSDVNNAGGTVTEAGTVIKIQNVVSTTA